MEFTRESLQDVESSLQREWLETNGLGGFASSTIVGVNTRRYHGLLVAATQPPVGRMVLLSKMEETVLVEGRHFDLGANRYPGVLYPHGFDLLQSFRFDPFPVFTYRAGEVEIEKSVCMIHGEHTVILKYEVRGAACTLEVRPLIAFRDYHSLMRRNGSLQHGFEAVDGLLSITPYAGVPTLHIGHDAGAVHETGNWYYNFEYDRERERGLDYREDLFNPLVLRFELQPGDIATITASTRTVSVHEAEKLRSREIARRRGVVAASPCNASSCNNDPFVQDLVAAADQYIVDRGDLRTVIAGYHWFSDWGRDTMVALPGLTLVTGRFEIAKQILRVFAHTVDQGMLPNRWPDAGQAPEYNTVDATLWFFEAVRAYLAYTGDKEFVHREMYPQLREIVDWHIRGTRFGIRVDEDGLLRCGEPGLQLTWMDVKIGDWVVTPRMGKPVEIQALWYNALRVMEELGDSRCGAMADLARTSFNARFWYADGGYLFDVVDGDLSDRSIRPNQIFAISLHHPVLDERRWEPVLRTVTEELLTPAGLRSLSPRDPAYRGRYEGDVPSRDSAYHQGTVWPWLMGPFLSAYLRLHGASASAREQAYQWVSEFASQTRIYGLGHISEIADGDAPHQPRGCIAQAWSVAELLRVIVEDVHQVNPNLQNYAIAAGHALTAG